MQQNIADSATIQPGVIIGDNVTIEENVFLDFGVIVRDNVHIKKNSKIGARCILGEYLADFYVDCVNGDHPLVIGENAIIRSETIIYGDSQIGDFFQTGHRVTVRERAMIGHHVRMGTLSDIRGDCMIGNYVNLHSNVHISMKSIIHDYVWIFPYTLFTNDPTPPSMESLGVEVESFAVICSRAMLMPGVHIGEDALISAGAVVTRDVEAETIVIETPAKDVGHINKVKNHITGEKVYPWRYTFERGMPWEGMGYDKWVKMQEGSQNE